MRLRVVVGVCAAKIDFGIKVRVCLESQRSHARFGAGKRALGLFFFESGCSCQASGGCRMERETLV
jgi:hypothetical protein